MTYVTQSVTISLQVYTSYTFALTACNSICASSDPIALSTIQEPPGEVLAPILLVLGMSQSQKDIDGNASKPRKSYMHSVQET